VLRRFEIIFFFSALSQMLVDQSYWQSAIAAKASCAVKVRRTVFESLCIELQARALSMSRVQIYCIHIRTFARHLAECLTVTVHLPALTQP